MNEGRKNSKTNIGSHGHAGGTRPGETRKTPKNLSAHESEERGREESVGLKAEHCFLFVFSTEKIENYEMQGDG